MSVQKALEMIRENDVKFIDFRFADTRGKEQHVTVPAHTIDEDTFEDGKMFDGSSVAGWKGINESDMILMPEAASAKLDPFFDDTTMILRCDIIEPSDMQGYNRDPRSIAKRAEAYMTSTGIADTAYFGPENEFFVFDDVKWADNMGDTFFKIDSEEAAYNSGKHFEDG
ncbi:MAG TPA: glutamine synthetase, partial [Methylococcaceae bacterium]|nr:glutamine synthetase [Methylococcaceae bacterium]